MALCRHFQRRAAGFHLMTSLAVTGDASRTRCSRSYLPRASIVVEPNAAWAKFNDSMVIKPITLLDPSQPKSPNSTRFVCISDTHTYLKAADVPPGDILIHAGDFTKTGTPVEVGDFIDFLNSLPHKHKVVIAGNHDVTFDPTSYRELWKYHRHLYQYYTNYLKEKLRRNWIYLEDETITLEGFTIHGSPWQPECGLWAFGAERGEDCQLKWDLIPEGVDILVTHGPPLGHGDLCVHGGRAGCVNLLDTVEYKVRPKMHIFGHIHEGYGVTTNGVTTFINCSSCDVRYKPVNPPIVFDLPNVSSDSADPSTHL